MAESLDRGGLVRGKGGRVYRWTAAGFTNTLLRWEVETEGG